MAFIYTYDDLQALAAKYQCCYADLARKALEAEMYNLSDFSCRYDKGLYMHRVTDIIANFIPDGTATSYTISADGTIDLTGLDPAQFTDGTSVSITTDYAASETLLGQGTIDLSGATIDDLRDELITLINSFSTGYVASSGGPGLVLLTMPGTLTSLPIGNTITLTFAPYWYKQLTTTVALQGAAATTFTMYQTAQGYNDPAYTNTSSSGKTSLYIESLNRLYVTTGARVKHNQTFNADLDAITDASGVFGPYTIGTGLDTTVYAPGTTLHLVHQDGATNIHALRCEIVTYDSGTGAITFLPSTGGGVFYRNGTYAAWLDESIDRPPDDISTGTQINPGIGNVAWKLNIGNGYGADAHSWTCLNVYEWNEGGGTLDYVDYVVLPGAKPNSSRQNLIYDQDNQRIYYNAYTQLSNSVLGYIDLGADPYSVAAYAQLAVNYMDTVSISPIYKTASMISTSGVNGYLLNTTSLATGANLNGNLTVSAAGGTVFDQYNRLLYLDVATGKCYYLTEQPGTPGAFADSLIEPSTSTLLFNFQASPYTSCLSRFYYNVNNGKIYILINEGGVIKLHIYDINPSLTQAQIEASVVKITAPTGVATNNTIKYVKDLEKLVFITSSSTMRFFDLSTSTFDTFSLALTTTTNGDLLIDLYGTEYDSTNKHLWITAAESSATPTKVDTISLTSNSDEVTGTVTGTITPNLHDGDRNCLTNAQIQNLIEQASRFCCLTCKSDADIIRDI